MSDPTPSPLPVFPRDHGDVPHLPETRSPTPIEMTAETDDATQEAVAIQMLHGFHREVDSAQRYFATYRSALPPQVATSWDAWVARYSQLVSQATSERTAFHQLFQRLSALEVDLETFRRLLVHYAGHRPAPSVSAPTPVAEERGPLQKPLIVGGLALVGGLVGGYLLAESRGR